MTTIDNTTPALRSTWHAVAMVHELGEDPHQVWLLGQPWVLARIDGVLVAFEDRCPHRLVPLSIGSVDPELGLRCGYHGWTFGTDGGCTSIPALGRRARSGDAAHLPPKARLVPAWGVTEAYGLVWLAPEEPLAPIPNFVEWGTDGFDGFWNEPRRTTSGAAQLVDNFLDASHFPFVHTGTFGTDEASLVVNEPVERDGWQVQTTFDTWYKNFDDPQVATGEHPEVQPQRLLKQGAACLSVYLRLEFPVTGATFSILFCCQPETATSTRIYKLMARDDLGADAARITSTIADELQILEEDLRILERYPHAEIHLDPTECHTRGDRLSVAWRRVLGGLVAATASTPDEVPVDLPSVADGADVLTPGGEARLDHRVHPSSVVAPVRS